LILLLGALPVQQASASNADHEQLLQQAETLLSQYKESEALRVYEEVLALEADNYEALCKASLLHNRIGDRYTDDSRKWEHFNKGKNYAFRAFLLNSADAESNYLMALSLAHIAVLSGPKQRLALTKDIKTYLDAALASDELHAGAWHLLGRWQYKMANLNFAEVAASKLFMGGVPTEASTEGAITAIRKAIEYNPENIRYYFDLASIYRDVKDRDSCITTLEHALSLNLETKEEFELSRRCRIMLDEQLR
jgi:tetratricopeptide (TPR) repeat protein